MNPWPILAVFGALALLILVFVWRRLKARTLGEAGKRRIARAWDSAVAHGDPVRQVLEADKALDMALEACGFRGTLGDKLKAAAPRLSDPDAVWRAHKLRNHVAHEAHASVTPAQADAALRALKRGIEDAIGSPLR